MTHTALVILNPNSGRGRGHKRAESVHRALKAAGLPYEAVFTESRGHAIELTRNAALNGWELIIAAGGDGTINEVVNGLMLAEQAGAHSKLGIMPVGTGNDFALGIGLPADLNEVAGRLVRGQTRRFDVGIVNGRYFDNCVGIGFDARINIEAHSITWVSGQMQYLLAVLRSLTSYPFPVVNIYKDDGDRLNKQVLMVSVGNGARMGGGFRITPDALPDDGKLDLCIVDALSRPQILRLLPKAMKGNHHGESAVELCRTTRLVVESSDPLPVHADGEILWNDLHRVEIVLEPQRLEVVV